MCRLSSARLIVCVFAAISLGAQPTAHAALSGSGDVTPTLSSWGTGTVGYVGYSGAGMVTVNGSSTLVCKTGYIGYSGIATGMVSVSGNGATWTNMADIYVGNSASGTLSISAGGWVTNSDSYIANSSTATGLVTLSGSASRWTTNSIMLGARGSATLSITNSAGSSNYAWIGYFLGSRGQATLSGPDAIWTNDDLFYVGNSGSGTLTLNSGANVGCSTSFIAWGTAATGMVAVSGTGSKWNSSSFFDIGVYGGGTISIDTGGSVSGTSCNIAVYSGGKGMVAVDGAGSSFAVTGSAVVGADGQGTLSISGGAAASNANGYLGTDSKSQGVVTVDGNSTWTNSGSLTVGRYGGGTVTQTGGTVSVAGGLYLAYNTSTSGSTATGVYNLKGGVLTLAALGKGVGSATFNFGGGTLQATGGFSTNVPMNLTGIGGNAVVNTAGCYVVFAGSLSGGSGLAKTGAGTLTLSAANTYTGTTTVGAGALVCQGTAAINAALTYTKTNVAAGALVFDYSANTASGNSIASQVSSILTTSYNGGTNSWASGTIYSTLANSHSTDSYALGWTNNTATSAVTVKVVLYGDATLDGTVNIYDLGQILANYNKSGTWATGDFNYDGTVNIYDLGKVLANYNKSLVLTGTEVSTLQYPTLDGAAIGALEAAGVSVVPEPGAVTLLTAGAIGLLAYIWHRRRQET
jgi:fibronectin-binding autotransporter adhesin